MSTSTLAPEARRNVVLFGGAHFGIDAVGVKKYKKEKDGKSVLVLENVPVFRSGTFRDSMGYQHSWDDIHMTQMVNHWNLLTEKKILESVPVKKGHGSFFGDPMDNLIGWHSGLSTEKRTNPIDGKEYTYLLANYEILDKDAIDKIESGLWRNLSSEISSYVTNDEMEFWPVYSGVAYVDFSAVEGLREFSKNNKFSLMFEDEKEAPAVGDQNNNGPAQQGASGTGEGQTQPTQPTQPPPNNGPAQQGGATGEQQPATQGTSTPEQQSPAEGEGGETTDHSKGGTQFCFMLNGKPTLGLPIAGLTGPQLQAFQSAQSHINYLEEYRKGQLEGHRTEFVKGLAASNKILASDIPDLTEAALEMSDNAFAKWSAAYSRASAPASNTELFQNHGAQPGNTNQPQAQEQANHTSERIQVLTEIVADHTRSGFSKEKLEATSSWQELQRLTAQQNQS